MVVVKMNPSDFTGIYGEIAEILGVECAIKLYENFKGQQIIFPQRLYTREYIKTNVSKKHADGKTVRDLAKEYGYSDRWIRKLLNG